MIVDGVVGEGSHHSMFAFEALRRTVHFRQSRGRRPIPDSVRPLVGPPQSPERPLDMTQYLARRPPTLAARRAVSPRRMVLHAQMASSGRLVGRPDRRHRRHEGGRRAAGQLLHDPRIAVPESPRRRGQGIPDRERHERPARLPGAGRNNAAEHRERNRDQRRTEQGSQSPTGRGRVVAATNGCGHPGRKDGDRRRAVHRRLVGPGQCQPRCAAEHRPGRRLEHPQDRRRRTRLLELVGWIELERAHRHRHRADRPDHRPVLTARRRHAADLSTGRSRRGHAQPQGSGRGVLDLVDGGHALDDDRSGGRYRLRPVHHLQAPLAAGRRDAAAGVRRAGDRYSRLGRRVRRHHGRHRPGRSVGGGHPVPDRDGPVRRGDGGRRRARGQHPAAGVLRHRRAPPDPQARIAGSQAGRAHRDGPARAGRREADPRRPLARDGGASPRRRPGPGRRCADRVGDPCVQAATRPTRQRVRGQRNDPAHHLRRDQFQLRSRLQRSAARRRGSVGCHQHVRRPAAGRGDRADPGRSNPEW